MAVSRYHMKWTYPYMCENYDSHWDESMVPDPSSRTRKLRDDKIRAKTGVADLDISGKRMWRRIGIEPASVCI